MGKELEKLNCLPKPGPSPSPTPSPPSPAQDCKSVAKKDCGAAPKGCKIFGGNSKSKCESYDKCIDKHHKELEKLNCLPSPSPSPSPGPKPSGDTCTCTAKCTASAHISDFKSKEYMTEFYHNGKENISTKNCKA